MGYELSDIEWKLNTEQLNKKLLLIRDNQVLNHITWKHPITGQTNLELAIKTTAYQIITLEFNRYFIKELHRIKSALASHKIDDHPDKFGRYIYTNYSGLLKLCNPNNTAKPKKVEFNSHRFMLKYEKLTLIQINYDLQTRFVTPLKKTFEENYQSEILPHPYVHAISERPATYRENTNPGNKAQWIGPLNKLATIFYELANTELHNGEPILRATPNVLAELIINNFTDKTGNDISKDTIQTILRPGKSDKRSPDHKKYKIPS